MHVPGLSYVRSIVLVSLVLSLSAASHVLAGGHLPDAGVMVLLGALLLVPMTLISRNRISFRAALVSMGAGQFLLHTLLGLTAMPADCRASAATPGHHAPFELACAPGAQSPSHADTGGLTMVLAHGVASVVLAVALSRTDEAVDLLRAWLAPVLDRVQPASSPVALPRDLLEAVPAPTPPLPVHACVPTLRGPPVPARTP